MQERNTMSNPISALLRDFLNRFGRAAVFANAGNSGETLYLLAEQHREAHAARVRLLARRRMARPLLRRHSRTTAVVRPASAR
jgi:hypothetical protein